MTERVDDEAGAGARLAGIFGSTAAEMKAKLESIQAGFSHGPTKGSGVEEVVRTFLRSRLPSSLGVTSGQAMDTRGTLSRQLDVILYDAQRTPMLFESPHEGEHTVPIEGVMAAIEIKSNLRRQDLPGILLNCQSVKQLNKAAFFTQPAGNHWPAYGRYYAEPPVFYSVFAFNSDSLYANAINEMNEDVDAAMRIDILCCLDRGVTLNANPRNSTDRPFTIDAMVEPGGMMMDFPSNQALLHWYAAMIGVVCQYEARPIDITRYLRSEMRAVGRWPAGTSGARLRAHVLEVVATSHGVTVEALEELVVGEVPPEALAALLKLGYAWELTGDETAEQVALLRRAEGLAAPSVAEAGKQASDS